MNRRFSLSQYRFFDLFFFGLILAFVEGSINLAASKWFPDQLYSVSATAAITSIVMIRWKGWAAIHAALGGLVLCAVLGAKSEQFAIYCGGNLLGLAGLLFTTRTLRAKIYGNGLFAMFYGIVVLLLMQCGRAAIGLAYGYGGEVKMFFSMDSLSILFTAIIMWVARRQDGLLEDQIGYIQRIQEEEE